MDNQKEILPLRIIAARFINTNEREGLDEIDRITADVYRRVYWQYMRLWSAFTASLFATVITLLPGIGFTLAGVEGGEVVAIIGLIPFCLLLGVLCRWRVLQYGGMTARKPQKAVYVDPDDRAVRNLERLFALLQQETTPRSFFRMKNGREQHIDERYFFGSLRAALVSKERPLRDMFLNPVGLWFSRELFMEADVAALIAQAKAEPSRSGTNKTYDYTDAIMSLIEHPDIRAMEVPKRGNQTKIKNLLEAWYGSKRQDAPSETQLMLYAKDVLNVIEKNRRANARH